MSTILRYLSEQINYFISIAKSVSITTSIACTMAKIKRLRNIGLYPRRIKVENFTIYINDVATCIINIPDQYIRKEYELHPAYVPSKGWIVLDIGAYVGLFSMRASRLVGDSGRIVAFEPNPLAWQWLKRHIFINKLGNVEALPIALGSYDGVTEFYILAKGNIGASSIIREHVIKQAGALGRFIVVKVPVFRLDSIAEKLRLNYVDLMKIDVEGAELDVLKGSKGIIERGRVERIIVEAHIDVINERDVKNFLIENNFKIDKSVRFDNIKTMYYARLVK